MADLIELEALQSGYSKPRREIADYLTDDPASARALRADIFTNVGGEELSDEIGDDLCQGGGLDLVEQIFALIDERKLILGDSYPFYIKGERLHLKEKIAEKHNNYLCLLDHTLSHHFGFRTEADKPPTSSFEEVSIDAFRAAGFISCGLMTNSGDFASRLEAAESSLGIVQFDVNNAIVRTSQQDARVDLLAINNFNNDHRPCRELLLGQVTCSKSGAWESKRSEPSIHTWHRLTKDKMSTRACLIVPHHAEYPLLENLAQTNPHRPIFDRLRLCLMLSQLPKAELPFCLKSFARFEVQGWGHAA